MTSKTLSDVRPRRWTLVSAGLLIALTTLFWLRTVRDVGLVGHDSYPIVVTSRVQSFGDLAGVFTEPLMDGRYPSKLYRPLLDLAVAAEHALFALEPLGYQVQSVLWLAGCAVMILLFARSVLGQSSVVGPLVAVLAFVAFPWNLEVVPVLARRPESMCALFLLAAVWSQYRRVDRRMPILPALLGLCAMGSKEPGMVAPALCFAAVLIAAPAGERLRRAGLALVPHAIALVMFLALRTAVLGGLGGHEDTSIVDGFTRFPRVVGLVLNELFVRPVSDVLPPALAIAGALIGLGLGLGLGWRDARRGDPQGARALRLAAFGALWILAVSFPLAASTDEPLPWYYTLPAVGGTLLLAGATEPLWRALRGGGGLRLAAGVGALLLSSILFGQTRRALHASSVHRWQRATELGTAYLDDLRRIVLEVPEQVPGMTVRAPFEWLFVEDTDSAVAWTPVLAEYSVQAWLDLSIPERPTRLITGEHPPAEPGVLLIELVGDGAKLPLSPRAHSE